MEPDEAAPAAPAARLLRRHRRRHDDDRAGDPAAGRDRRRGAGPGPRSPSCPPRWPRRSTSAGRRWRRPTGRFLGIAHIQRLLREPPSALVSGVVDTTIEPLRPDVPLAAITHHLATYNLVAVPVVDENDHLLGAVTVDDVLDHLLPEDWRDTRPRPLERDRRRRAAVLPDGA